MSVCALRTQTVVSQDTGPIRHGQRRAQARIVQCVPHILPQSGKVNAAGTGRVIWRQLLQMPESLVVIAVGQAAVNPAFVQCGGQQNHALQEVALGAGRLQPEGLPGLVRLPPVPGVEQRHTRGPGVLVAMRGGISAHVAQGNRCTFQ